MATRTLVSRPCASPLDGADDGLSLVGSHGHEVAWGRALTDLPDAARALIRRSCISASSARRCASCWPSAPSRHSQWTVETDVGSFDFLLRSEEDIRRLDEGRLMITTSHGGAALRARPLEPGPALEAAAGTVPLSPLACVLDRAAMGPRAGLGHGTAGGDVSSERSRHVPLGLWRCRRHPRWRSSRCHPCRPGGHRGG